MEEHHRQQPTTALKIAVLGPEKSVKSKLCAHLEQEFPELNNPKREDILFHDSCLELKSAGSPIQFLQIGFDQLKHENENLSNGNGLFLTQTCVLETKIFSDLFLGESHPILEKMAKKHKYDLFVLLDADLTLSSEKSNAQSWIGLCESDLQKYNKPYLKWSELKEKDYSHVAQIVTDLKKTKLLGFTSHDFVQCYHLEISPKSLETQFEFLISGVPFVTLDRIAQIKDGIQAMSDDEAHYYAHFFDSKKEHLKLKKFVPASGAASRMFKFLSEFLAEFKMGEESINAYVNRKKAKNLALFLVGIEKFPFYSMVHQRLQEKYADFLSWTADKKHYHFIKILLDPNEFDVLNKPKGVLPFHQYATHVATPVEEHLTESLFYATSNGKANVHFTVSEEHQAAFDELVHQLKPKLEHQFNTEIKVSFSYQSHATDSIALDEANNLVRDKQDNLIFRPGGHGALLDNLNQLQADIVFIKNIDNVIQNHIDVISKYKKALGGILLEKQEKIFAILKALEQSTVSKDFLDEVVDFIQNQLHFEVAEAFSKFTKESKIEYLQNYLNRPIRVCGMVKNEGEPGGGPFWVQDRKGLVFLQIVESSQINLNDSNQLKIVEKATHFNPVDIVCGLKDFRGLPFNLKEFTDPQSGFIVHKHKGDKEIKAYELPGLWNGGMAKWLTIFVEVPLITFNPVKTVNDLLKSPHQPL